MTGWIKGFWRGLAEEIFMKSQYGKEIGIDTFFRWLVCIGISVGFYLWVYNFDARGVETDKWFHEVLGWKLSDIPSPAKVAWHRLTAGVMCGTGIFIGTLGFAVSLYRRIKARIAASKTKNVKTGSEQCPHA